MRPINRANPPSISLDARRNQPSKSHYLLLIFFIVCLPGFVAAQTERITVSGFVRDTGRVAMPQVTVHEKGTNNTTMTQSDGSFSLSVQGPASTLVFSFIGYETQEQRVGDQTVFAVALVQSNSDLGEVIVVGYDTKKKG